VIILRYFTIWRHLCNEIWCVTNCVLLLLLLLLLCVSSGYVWLRLGWSAIQQAKSSINQVNIRIVYCSKRDIVTQRMVLRLLNVHCLKRDIVIREWYSETVDCLKTYIVTQKIVLWDCWMFIVWRKIEQKNGIVKVRLLIVYCVKRDIVTRRMIFWDCWLFGMYAFPLSFVMFNEFKMVYVEELVNFVNNSVLKGYFVVA